MSTKIGTSIELGGGADMESIEAILGEIEVEAAESVEAIEEIGELSPEEERHLDAEITKAEVYEATDAGAMEVEAVTEATPRKTRERTAKAPKPAGEKKDRVVRDIASLAPEAFVLTSEAPDDLEANKAEVLSKRPGQVKIAEKFDNIIGALSAGRSPSVYVTKCFEALAATGEATQTQLVKALETTGYTIGTARSQAGQCMTVFAALGIATREGQKLTLRSDSAYAAKLLSLASPAPEA